MTVRRRAKAHAADAPTASNVTLLLEVQNLRRGVLALVEIGKAVCTICPIRRPQRMLTSSVAHPRQVLRQRCHRRHQRGLGAGRPGGCLPLLQRLVAMSLWFPRRNRRWRTAMPWVIRIWRWRDDILSRLRSSCALFACLLRTSRWASAHQNRIDLLLQMSLRLRCVDRS